MSMDNKPNFSRAVKLQWAGSRERTSTLRSRRSFFLDIPFYRTSLTGGVLVFPAGVAVGPDGNVYVSNGGAFVPEGQMVRLTNH